MEEKYSVLYNQINQYVFDLLIAQNFDNNREQNELFLIHEHANLFLILNKSIIDNKIQSIIEANHDNHDVLNNLSIEYISSNVNNTPLYDLITKTRKQINRIRKNLISSYCDEITRLLSDNLGELEGSPVDNDSINQFILEYKSTIKQNINDIISKYLFENRIDHLEDESNLSISECINSFELREYILAKRKSINR